MLRKLTLSGPPLPIGLLISCCAFYSSFELSAKPHRGPQKAQEGPTNTPVTLKGVSLKELSKMRSPKLIDVDPIDKQLGLALSGLEALTHMSKMVPEEHA
jgi:hypothetical protein